MRPASFFLLLLLCASSALVPSAAATESCTPHVRPHPTGAVVECRVANTGVVVVVGWQQHARCDTSDGNVVVIVGSDNMVDCTGGALTPSAADQCPPVAFAAMGTASSCGLTIVILGEGEGRIVIVGWGKAQGGVIALVVDGCAAQNQEGAAYGIFGNTCGRSILGQTDTPAGALP